MNIPAPTFFKVRTKKTKPVWCKLCGRKHSKSDACEVYQVAGASIHEDYGALHWSVIPQKKEKSDAKRNARQG